MAPPQADGASTLSRWLAELIAASPAVLAEVAPFGKRVGAALDAGEAGEDAGAALMSAFTTLGFAPRRVATGTDEVALCLCHCPYREAAASAGEVVCTLHRGITEGLVARADPGAELVAFVPHDPFEAGCEVRVRPGG